MSFIKRLWNGDVRLVITYWVCYFIPSAFFFAIFSFIDQHYERVGWSTFTPGFASLYLLGMLLVLAYTIFMWIALWRSSDKYTGIKTWSVLVKIVVILGVMRTGVELSKNGTNIRGLFEYATRISLSSDSGMSDIEQELSEAKKNLPVKVDEITTLSDVAVNGKVISYKYKIKFNDKFTHLSGNAAETMKKLNMGRLCDLPLFKRAFEDNYYFRYVYYGEGQDILTQYSIKENDCATRLTTKQQNKIIPGNSGDIENYIRNQISATKFPVRLDETTTLTGAHIKGKTIVLLHKIEIVEAELPNVSLSFSNDMKIETVSTNCKNPMVKKSLEHEYRMKYVFYIDDMNIFSHFYIDAEDCNPALKALKKLDKSDGTKF